MATAVVDAKVEGEEVCEGEWSGLNVGKDVMASLLSRFILNLPQSELNDWNRIFYHLEHMWWFYLDHLANPSLNPGQRLHFSNHSPSFLTFAQRALNTLNITNSITNSSITNSSITNNITNNRTPGNDLKIRFTDYERYKRQTPVAGCAPVRYNPNTSMMEVLMVRPAGTSRWGFSKGKQNAGESLHDTATRETREETGFHISTKQIGPICWSTPSNNSDLIHIFPIFVGFMNENKSVMITKEEGPASLEVDEVQWMPLFSTTHISSAHEIRPSMTLTNLAHKLWPKLVAFAISHCGTSESLESPTRIQKPEHKSPLNAKAASFTPTTTGIVASVSVSVSGVQDG
jgi:8-oxo-dGTP pyrophosphatase MutT (NUDIX family)